MANFRKTILNYLTVDPGGCGVMMLYNNGRNGLLGTNKTTDKMRWNVFDWGWCLSSSVIRRFALQDIKTKPSSSSSVCQTLAPIDFTALGNKVALQSKLPVRLSRAVQFLHYRAVIKQWRWNVPLKLTVTGNSHFWIYEIVNLKIYFVHNSVLHTWYWDH